MYTIKWLLGRIDENQSEADVEAMLIDFGLCREGLTIKTKLWTTV